MAPLRFPGRPGYRFDRIGVRYCANEARNTTDPTIAVIGSITKGLNLFRSTFGDSDEDETEFLGFTPAEVKAAEQNLQQAIKEERLQYEQQVQKQLYRFERSKAALASLAAARLELPKKSHGVPENSRKTYKKIIDTSLVKDVSYKFRSQPPIAEITSFGKQNGQTARDKISSLKQIPVKRVSHNVDSQSSHRRPVGRPKRDNDFLGEEADIQKGSSFESIKAASSVFGGKPISKYTPAARQILARATKQAAQTSNKLLTTPRVRKFVLPTKSSRSSRVIKPNKRFLEDDSVHQLVAKQPKIGPTSPSVSSFKTPIFGMGVSVDKSNSFSAFQSCGLSLSPFSMNREKGFPVFSAAPQPSGTSSFMDGLANQKPLGSLDQPLIVEGKRPRKPSLIMRMKLVEDDPADEIRLQQQMSDTTSSVKLIDGQKPHTDSKISSTPLATQTKCFGATKSLIAPAKLFTDSSTYSLSSKSFKQSLHNKPSQSTVVLRQAKFQLNRTALNRSKAALARSLKAQLKREAKLESRKQTSHSRLERLSGAAPSTGSSLSQLSPFSKLASDSAIERQKSGLFEGIEAGAGSFSPSSFGSPPVTPSSLPSAKQDYKAVEDYQASLIKEEVLLINYFPKRKSRCLVCSMLCFVKRNRKLPQVPLCRSCKKCYFFQLRPTKYRMSRRRPDCEGKCDIHFSERAHLHCLHCKFAKFEAILAKCKKLGIKPHIAQHEKKKKEQGHVVIDDASPVKKQKIRSEEIAVHESKQNKQEEPDGIILTRRRRKHKSGEKFTELSCLQETVKSPSHSKELINASHLDKPLSVDVGQDTDPFNLSPPQTLSSTMSSPDKNSKHSSKKLNMTSNGSDRVSENDEDNDSIRSRGSSRGPRIKHVCRRAAMVFPQQRATFPEQLEKRTLTLSALPNEEKQQLWAKSKQEKTEDSSSEESVDDKPQSKLAAIASPDKKLQSPKDDKQTDIRKDRKLGINQDKKATTCKEEKVDDVKESRISRNKPDAKTVQSIANRIKRKRSLASEKEKVLLLAARRRGYSRKIRCKECKGCKTPECGVCVFCRDKPKFGGPGRIKKCCIHSVCLAPKIPRKVTQSFIEPKSPTKTNRRDDDDQNGDHYTRNQNSGAGFRESSSRYQEKRTNNHCKMDGNGDGAKDDGETEATTDEMDTSYENGLTSGPSSSSTPNGLDMDGSQIRPKPVSSANNSKVVRYAKGKYTPAVEATIQLALTDVRNPFLGSMSHKYGARFKHRDKLSVPQKHLQVELKPVQNETAYSFDVPLKTHLIRADYEEGYDIELAWSHGFSLTLTGPSCVRALCYLCGSAGKHEMLYCIVCCQPYHSFCLDEEERPEEECNEEGDDVVDDSNHHHHGSTNSNTISWCCRRCQFCHVCGQQNGLLKCHRCKDTYHPECLGPNYPTRPSNKNIWVCTKCVRCKSCGATTPGVGTNASWTYDFSLCYECGKLMDKGNFCPICHKCYSDDDWESKMVQCAICESWVHAKCEELTDEMYQLVSFLPEEVQYTCRVCSTDSPPYWERVLKSELVTGLLNVLNGLLGSKCAQMLLELGPPRDFKKLKNIKGRCSDESRVNLDDSFNSETNSNLAFNSSTDSADSSEGTGNPLLFSDVGSEQLQQKHNDTSDCKLNEQSLLKSSEHSVTYTKNLLNRLDKEIVEKCDCEAVESSTDNQSKGMYSHIVAKGILFDDKPVESDNFNKGDHSLNERSSGTSNHLHTSASSLSGLNVVGLKMNGLSVSELKNMTNRESNVNMNAKGINANDMFLGLTSKDRVMCNPKIVSTINDNLNCSRYIQKTLHNNCDTSNCNNSISTDVTMAVSAPCYRAAPLAITSQNMPSISSLCTQSSLSISVTEAQARHSTNSVPPSNSVSTIPPSFYTNCSKENTTKNLSTTQLTAPDHQLKPDVQKCNSLLKPSSNCFFAENTEENHVYKNNNKNGISLENHSKYEVHNIGGSEYGIQTTHIHKNGSSVNHVQQEVLSSLPSTTGEPHVELKDWSIKDQEEQIQENGEIAVPNPARTSLHVRFGITVQETLNMNSNFPKDFNSIRLKIDSGSYGTVEEFSEDMVRIIQTLLFENEQFTTRKKQANSVRSIFIKQMERYFPWFNVNTCKLWEHNIGLPAGMLRDAVLPPSSDHTYAQWLERKTSPMSPQPSPFKRVNSPQKRSVIEGESFDMSTIEKMKHYLVQNEDARACLLCQKFGDDEGDFAGRLLYCGQDDWIHINCALWSAEVFEQEDGSLLNVQEAITRGKKLRCNLCQLTGATVGCCEANCRANYHFMCARADKCVFQEDRTIFCHLHSDCVKMNVVKDGHFDIIRRVCVNLDKIRAKSAWGKAVDPATLNVIIGSCTVESLGVLQSSLSDTEECLYPIDFRCTRIYWSTQDARRRCVYTCRIVKVEPDTDSPAVIIHDLRVVHDQLHPDYIPLDQLNLENLGIPNFIKHSCKFSSLPGETCDEKNDVIFMGCDLSTTSITSVSFTSQTVSTNTQAFGKTLMAVGNDTLKSALSRTLQNQELLQGDPENCITGNEDDPHGMSRSWPVRSLKPKVPEPRRIDLSGLSPSTIALLSIKDPLNYIIPSPCFDSEKSIGGRPVGNESIPIFEEKEELGLIKIADRLNSAASGKSRQPTFHPERGTLRSRATPLCIPMQQHRKMWLQMQQSKSQCSSPVNFEPKIRARSNSEGKHENTIPLLSPPAITRVFPATLSHPQIHRARSESPFSVIKPPDIFSYRFRSSSLSPPPVAINRDYNLLINKLSFPTPFSFSPTQLQLYNRNGDNSNMENVIPEFDTGINRTSNPVSVTPILEVLENEEEEKMTTENANKKTNLDSFVYFDNFEENEEKKHQSEFSCSDNNNLLKSFDNNGSSGSMSASQKIFSDIISTENLKSILESVPHEVLAEEVKVVVLSDIEDLTEDDVVELALSVMLEANQAAGLENVESDNGEEKSEGSNQENKTEEASSNQGSSSSAIEGDNVETESGGDATNNDRENDSSSNSSIHSSEQTSCSHSKSTNIVSLPASSSSSTENTHEENDDDDLKKPQKDELNKKHEDVTIHDFDENIVEKENESQDTSFEIHSDFVKDPAVSDLGQNKMLTSQLCSRNLIIKIKKLDEATITMPSGQIEISDEMGNTRLTSNKKIKAGIFSAKVKDAKRHSSLNSIKDQVTHFAFKKSHPDRGSSSSRSGKQSQCVLPSTEIVKGQATKDSTSHVMEDPKECVTSAFVKVVDIDSSQKSESISKLKIIKSKTGNKIIIAGIKNIKKDFEINADKGVIEDKSETILLNNKGTDQLLSISKYSAVKAKVSENCKGTVNLSQGMAKTGVNTLISKQDTTTDDDSDYLMLDDFSYSETNDEDECVEGKNSTDSNKEQMFLPKIENPKEVSHESNCHVNNLEFASESYKSNTSLTSSLLDEKYKRKMDKSENLSKTPNVLVSNDEQCDVVKSAGIELMSLSVVLNRCPEIKGSENNAQSEQKCLGMNVLESSSCGSDVKLKSCFISLCRKNVTNNEDNLSSSSCSIAGTSQSETTARNASAKSLDICLTKNICKVCPEEEMNQTKIINLSILKHCEPLEGCSQPINADVNKQTSEVTLLEIKNDELEEESTRNEQTSENHQSEVLDLKINQILDQETEITTEVPSIDTNSEESKHNIMADDNKEDTDVIEADISDAGLNKDERPTDNKQSLEKHDCFMEVKASNDHTEPDVEENIHPESGDHASPRDDDAHQTDILSQDFLISTGLTHDNEKMSSITPDVDNLNNSENNSELVNKEECVQQDNTKTKGIDEQDNHEVSELDCMTGVTMEGLIVESKDKTVLDTILDNKQEENVKKCIEPKEMKSDKNTEVGTVSHTFSKEVGTVSKHKKSQDSSNVECVDGDIHPDSEEDEKELVQIDKNMSTTSNFTKPTEDVVNDFAISSIQSEQMKGSGSGSDDYLHGKIVEKIKAESLARSSPGEEGPFKCPTCKRMYRTRESFELHIRDCDFEVSTSDDEEKPIVKELRSHTKYKAVTDGKKLITGVEKINSLTSSPSPLNEPLTIIITDEYKDDKFSPSSRDLSDDCSSVQSQDSRRSSLRKSTVTQRNAAPAHLAKARSRDSKLSSMSPDGSTCSSLLSPKSSTSRVDEKPSPKETMLEAIGLVSRRSLELSPNSDLDKTGTQNITLRLQPRVSPTALTPKREKRSPAHAGTCGIMRPSILAGGMPKPGSSHLKSIAITYDPVVVEEITLEPFKPKKPRQKRIWWIEASECPDGTAEEKEENVDDERDEDDDDDSDEEESVACRTRQKMTSELKSPTIKGKSGKIKTNADGSNKDVLDEPNKDVLVESNKDKSISNSDESCIHKRDESINQVLIGPTTEISDQTNILTSDEVKLQTTDKTNTLSDTCTSNKTQIPISAPDESKSETSDQLSTPKDESLTTPATEKSTSHLRSSLRSNKANLLKKEHVTELSNKSRIPALIDDIKEKSKVKRRSNNETKLEPSKEAVDEEKQANVKVKNSLESSSLESSLPIKNLRSTRSRDRKVKDDFDDKVKDDGVNEQMEDSLTSAVRKSRRAQSKTTKLSEYLTELKKEPLTKDEIKCEHETQLSSTCEPESLLPDVNSRRRRSRPQIYPETERPTSNEKTTRGRQCKADSGDSVSQEKLEINKNDPLLLSGSKNVNVCEESSVKPVLNSEPRSSKTSKRSHKILRRSSSSTRSSFEINKEENDIKVQTLQTEIEAMPRPKDEGTIDNAGCVVTTNYKSVLTTQNKSIENEIGKTKKLDKLIIEKSNNRNNETDNIANNNDDENILVAKSLESTQTVSSKICDIKDSQNIGTTVGLNNCNEMAEIDNTIESSGSYMVSEDPTIKNEDLTLEPPDKNKQPGQKLRIIIRSPNVAAAQTIGELIKKTALSVNPKTLDVTVTTKNSSITQDNIGIVDKYSEKAIDEKPAKSLESFLNEDMGDRSKKDSAVLDDKDDTPMESRSSSPDSISQAYDIQSDDFSSETSNDGDDFESCVSNNVDNKPPVSCAAMSSSTSNSLPLCTASSFVDKVNNICTSVNNDDDDVILVKAAGLQLPEPSLTPYTSQAPYTLLNHPHAKMPISTVNSQQYSNALAVMANTSNSVAVTSCGRILTTPPVLQQSGAIPHISTQQHLTLSPTRHNIHPFMNIHQQTSPQQSQPSVMISEVSPGRFILQQQPSTRQDFITSQDINQSGLLLQNPVQPSILIQTPNQSGIAFQNAPQPGIIFRHSAPAGLMLHPSNSTNILQGQSSILQSTGQGGLSFISLNPSNPLTPAIISPIQPMQSHVNSSQILPVNMGMTPLMQTVTLGSQPMMISQPFIAQPGVYLPHLSSQAISSQHSDQVDLTRRQQQLQSPQPPNKQQLVNTIKPTSVIIDPHAHMLSSGLNQTALKANMQQYSPGKQRPATASSGLDQKMLLTPPIQPQLSTFQSTTNPSPALLSLPTTSSILTSQTLNSYPSPNILTPLNVQKTNLTVPKLTKVDGAPAQVNYMGSFDLNTSSLQSVINGNQNLNQDSSKRIMELVQTALKNYGKEQIPGVEVTTAITNTPNGPKKVLRVFINEDILPGNTTLSTSSASANALSSGITSVVMNSLTSSHLPYGHANRTTTSQTGTNSEWTKILPNNQTLQSHQQSQQNVWSSSNSNFISIPINQSLSANKSSSPLQGNSRFLPSAQHRRALKPAVYSHHIKRKLSPSSSATDNPQAKRPVFEKTLKSDGIFSGMLQQIVERHSYISNPASQHVSSFMPPGLSKPDDSSYINNVPSNQTMPYTSLINSEHLKPLSQYSNNNIPTPVTELSNANLEALESSQQYANESEHQPHHPSSEEQQIQKSPHKRASFPFIFASKKPQDVSAPTKTASSLHAKKVLQKNLLNKDRPVKSGKEAKTKLVEKKKAGITSKRNNAAVVASHHPLIHHKKSAASLPQPTLEEEVVATPLDPGKGDHPHSPCTKGDKEKSRLRFEIVSDDGFSCQGDTVEDAWNQVLEKVQDVRAASRMKQLSYAGISGRAMFGLDHEAVVYLIEQLYGAVHCHHNYKFRFHKYDLDQADEEVALNPSGSARSEFFVGRKPFDMFNFLKSVYRTKPGDDEREKEEEMALKSSRRATSLSLPMAMRFRKLKTFAKEAVDVYRSKIHGRGLFCKRNIDAGEMVIEYAGEVIRASLTDKREKYYESRGIGCYMFRIDDDEVVDATMHGSAARFINHSCEPNCFSKVILVDGKKHIVIFAMRPIKRGEELTYDYKFPIEEVKIPCSCGSKRCRKYLN